MAQGQNNTLSRRAALTAAAVAPLAVLSCQPSPVLAMGDPDADMLATFREAHALECRACVMFAEAEDMQPKRPAAPQELFPKSYREDTGVTTYGAEPYDREFIERQIAQLAGRPKSQAAWLAKRDILDRLDAEYQAACEACGSAARERDADALHEKAHALYERVIATPAKGALGLCVKLALWRHRDGSVEYVAGFGTAPLVSALRDMDAIAGQPGGAPVLPLAFFQSGSQPFVSLLPGEAR